MTQFTEITPEQAWRLVREEGAALLDVRDTQRFSDSRAQGAFHLTNHSYGAFQDEYDFDDPVIIYCYQGTSSRNTAQFLIEQGYERVYSVQGGFDGWVKAGLPIETAC